MFLQNGERADGSIVNGFPCSVLRDSNVLFIQEFKSLACRADPLLGSLWMLCLDLGRTIQHHLLMGC